MSATQCPVLNTRSATTAGAQLFTTADLASGFLADALAQDSTQYRIWFRSSAGNCFVGPSGHGGGGGDYDELVQVGATAEYQWPDMVRREDLEDFYAYASSSKDFYTRIAKVVA